MKPEFKVDPKYQEAVDAMIRVINANNLWGAYYRELAHDKRRDAVRRNDPPHILNTDFFPRRD